MKQHNNNTANKLNTDNNKNKKKSFKNENNLYDWIVNLKIVNRTIMNTKKYITK